MADDFIDDEAQELFRELRIEIGREGEGAQPRDLSGFTRWISGGEAACGFVASDGLGDLEAFGKHENEGGINIVDALAVALQNVVGHGVLRGNRDAYFCGGSARTQALDLHRRALGLLKAL